MTFVPTTANSLNARDGKGADPGRSVSNDVAHALTADGFDASEDGTGRGTPLVTHALDGHNHGAATEDGTGRGVPLTPYTPELADPIGANEARTTSNAGNNPRPRKVVAFAENQCGELRTSDVMTSLGQGGGKPGEGYPAVAFQPRVARNGRGAPDTVASALTSEAGRTGKGDSAQCVATGMQVRRLAPTECEALMGYPRNWTLVPYNGKDASDSPRYRAIGNGWVVPVVRWIFERLDGVERITASSRPKD